MQKYGFFGIIFSYFAYIFLLYSKLTLCKGLIFVFKANYIFYKRGDMF
jgi:hypothetical protein